MPQLKPRELRGLSLEELRMKRQEHEKTLSELRQKKITGQLDKPHEFKLLRKQIARANTIEKEKTNADTSHKK